MKLLKNRQVLRLTYQNLLSQEEALDRNRRLDYSEMEG